MKTLFGQNSTHKDWRLLREVLERYNRPDYNDIVVPSTADDSTVTDPFADNALTDDEFLDIIDRKNWIDDSPGAISNDEIRHFWVAGARNRFGEVCDILAAYGSVHADAFAKVRDVNDYRRLMLDAVLDGTIRYPQHDSLSVTERFFKHDAEAVREELPAEFRHDKDFALAAVTANAFAYADLPKFLRLDRDVALTTAVTMDTLEGFGLGRIDARFLDDRDFIREWKSSAMRVEDITQIHDAIWGTSTPLRDDLAFMLELFDGNRLMALQVTTNLAVKSDRDFIREVMLENAGWGFDHAAESIRADTELAKLAVRLDPFNIAFVPTELTAADAVSRFLYEANQHVEGAEVPVWHDREFWDIITTSNVAFNVAPKEMLADRDAMLKALAIDGMRLKDSAAELKRDPDVVRAAIMQNGAALEYADPVLKADPDIVLAAIAHEGKYFCHAAKSLQRDRRFVLKAVRIAGTALEWADTGFQDDAEIVRAAVLQNPLAYACASERLRDDMELARLAIAGDVWTVFSHASARIRSDPDMVRLAIEKLQRDEVPYIFNSLKIFANDAKLLHACIAKFGVIPSKAIGTPLLDKVLTEDMALSLIKDSFVRFNELPEKFRLNPDFVRKALWIAPDIFIYMDTARLSVLDDRELARHVLVYNGYAIDRFPEKWRHDPEFAVIAVRHQDGYEKLPEGLRHLPAVALEWVKTGVTGHPSGNYPQLPLALRDNRDITRYALWQNAAVYDWLPASLTDDTDFMDTACERNVHILQHLPLSRQQLQLARLKSMYVGYAFPSEIFDSYDALIRYMQRYTVAPERFRSLDTFAEIYGLKPVSATMDGDRPIVPVIYPVADANGAFTRYPLVDQLVQSGQFRVKYREAADEGKFAGMVAEFTTLGVSADTGFLAGHGSDVLLALGGDDPAGLAGVVIDAESRYLDTADLAAGQFRELGDIFAAGADLYLYSCSNGQGGENADNLANGFAAILPSSVTVHASQVSMNIRDVVITDAGEIHVEWTTPRRYDTPGRKSVAK